MNIEFARASLLDIQKLIEVQNKSFYDDFLTYGECPVYNELPKAMEKHINHEIVYKILKDNEIIGDIIIRKNLNNKYYLRVISIIPEYQNLGIGQKAIIHIENDISDAVEWQLITSFKSYRNHYFYEKMGYTKVSEYVHSEFLTMFVYRKQLFPSKQNEKA